MLQELTDKSRWDALVLQGEWHQFLQSWEWGEFQMAAGERVFRLADGEAYGQVVEKSLPFGLKLWFLPRGPTKFSVEHFVELQDRAKKATATLVRFEPPKKPSVGILAKSVTPTITLRTNLDRSEEELLATMHPKTRYNLRLAEKKGVVVRKSQAVTVWLHLHHETTARDEFAGHPDEYYRKMLALPMARLFIAELEGKPLAALIAIFFGDTVTYLHGASSDEQREVMAPHLLHWHVMQQAKQSGRRYYDWYGINPLDAKHPAYKKSWEGITRFKRGFGGEEIILPGTFEIPTCPLLFKLYRFQRALRGR